MDGAFQRRSRRDLECEAAFPGASVPGDRDQSDSGRHEKRLDARERIVASHEAVVEGRKAGCRQRFERREVFAEPWREQLEDLRRSGDVLQPVVPQWLKRCARERLLAGHVSRCARDDDLLAVCRRTDASGDDDVHPDIPLRAELRLARVDADAQAVRLLVGPVLDRKRALDLGRRRNRVAGPREREEHAVAGPVDLGAVVVGRGLAHELPHASARGREPLAEQVQQPRRSLDVGEQERHRPRRQPAARVVAPSHGRSLGAGRLGVYCALRKSGTR